MPPRIAVAVALVSACAHAPTDHPQAVATPAKAPLAFPQANRSERFRKAFPALEAFLREDAAKNKYPSLAFGVVVDGALVDFVGVGTADDKGTPVTQDTVYRIGSMTKVFTATAALRLRDEGELSLDAPVSQILPEFVAIQARTSDAPPVTLRHLLTHTSGLPSAGGFSWAKPEPTTRAEILASLGSTSFERTPEEARSYSNLGVMLAGLALENAAGRPYRDEVSASLLAPLGMAHSVWDPSLVPAGALATPHERVGDKLQTIGLWNLGAAEAAGGLFSTVSDLARWMAFQLAAWPARSDPETGPVRRSSLRESHTFQRLAGLVLTEHGGPGTRADGQGLGWMTYQDCRFDRVVWHNGGVDGFKSAMYFVPSYGFGVIALVNEGQTWAVDGTARGALKLLQREAGVLPRAQPPSPAMQAALVRWLTWFSDPTDEAYARTFEEGFRRAKPADQLRPLSVGLRSELGAVVSTEPAKVDGDRSAHFLLRFEKEVEFDLSLMIDEAGLVTGTHMEEAAAPNAPGCD